MVRKVGIALDEAVDGLLNQTGNKSGYIATAVQQRWQDWTWALNALRSAGWTKPELMAACDALNGTWLLGPSLHPKAMALELYDAERLTKMAAKWQLDPARWQDLVRAVADNPEITLALCISARECFSGNDAWDSALQRM